MMPISVKPIPINELNSYEYIIADYQRGYRWGPEHVLALLEDIKECMEYAEKHPEERYCLQPIVVRNQGGNTYEVIDGQQRLTTINIIHRYLKKNTFAIDFRARPSSTAFLVNIGNSDKQNTSSSNKIDSHYMQEAFDTIVDWFDPKENTNLKPSPTFPDEFYIFLGKNVDIIWYEDKTSEHAEKIFSRLNNGKIPLTGAELVKALFLSDDNINRKEKKQEIALEWDVFEKQLQHDSFWYFINGKANLTNPRIEYLLDTVPPEKSTGEHSTFNFFHKEFNAGISADSLWDMIRSKFLTLEEWYLDIETYHYIGFLFASRSINDISPLMSEYSKLKTKPEFKGYLIEQLKNEFKPRNLFELTYTDDAAYIKKVLLLFNVLTYLNQGIRFPFENYVINEWSLEHIHAQNSKGLTTNIQWECWIKEHIQLFQDFHDDKFATIIAKLQSIKLKDLTRESFGIIFEETTDAIKDDYGIDLHTIDNLALLDKDTNSALNNDIFDLKRKKIITRDKQGIFIPLCTRNVFLKYYNKELAQGYFWSEKDRSQYKSAIEEVICKFVPISEVTHG